MPYFRKVDFILTAKINPIICDWNQHWKVLKLLSTHFERQPSLRSGQRRDTALAAPTACGTKLRWSAGAQETRVSEHSPLAGQVQPKTWWATNTQPKSSQPAGRANQNSCSFLVVNPAQRLQPKKCPKTRPENLTETSGKQTRLRT